MFEQLQKDTSSFKKDIGLLSLIIILLVVAAYVLTSMSAGSYQKMLADKNTAQEKKEWLQQFDYAGNQLLLTNIPKLPLAANIDTVIQEQLATISNHNIQISDIKNKTFAADTKSKNGSKLPYVQCDLQLEGEWEQITSCLNNLESRYVLSISKLQIEQNSKGPGVKAKVQYKTYYKGTNKNEKNNK